MNYKLGKKPAKRDSRNLKLVRYLPKKLPALPPLVRWDLIRDIDWRMLGNDEYGNCLVATVGHIIMSARANESGRIGAFSEANAIKVSRRMGLLDGGYLLDRLKWWRDKKIFSTRIRAFTEVDLQRKDLAKAAVYIFGALDLGLLLCENWTDGRKTWDIGTGPGYQPDPYMGHSVPALGYDLDGLYVCSWGQIYLLTWRAYFKHCDEAYCSILPVWLAKDHLTPSGFDMPALKEDLAEL